ncbi:hypothetical protein ACPPVT_10535 [Angustibacter sp. McL0619]|uniref:hypothetical protein n=1 Tax=Angustibacter sp. McL0619 TaxID=3415676 RepID=UPI003CEED37F
MYGPDTRQAALTALAQGRTLSDVGRELLVSRATLREWRARQGGYAPGQLARTLCPRSRPLDEKDYAHLLGLYLGDGWLTAHPRDVYALRISCDARYPNLIDECRGSMLSVLARRVCLVTAPGCVQVTAYSKHWPCLFPQHGPGHKHERPIVLEPWQREIVEQHPGRFVRGLIHSDGCRVTNRVARVVGGQRRRYEYPRYFFTNASEDILELAAWALDLLGVQHRRPTARNISVARADSVAVLDQQVGPKS